MTGFTVTDEAVEAAAKSIWEGVETEIAWPPSEDSYDDAEVVRATARAALEAAARTAQSAPSQFSAPAPAPLGLALYPTVPPVRLRIVDGFLVPGPRRAGGQ